MKTLEHGRCPVVPSAGLRPVLPSTTETDLVTTAVDGVLYRHISMGTVARRRGPIYPRWPRAHPTVKSWATLFHKILQGLTMASTRHIYTSTGVTAPLTHLARRDAVIRGEQQHAGLSVGHASLATLSTTFPAS
ncbi:hypothetical protein DPEC_G00380360 [Dallia pectoralis]|nr:hypothetical protein DPEC_G00380360 [Dallia pectoralis]